MKNKRHEMILQLIGQQDIETQEALCEALCRAGFQVTQATVSRDIKQLALIKITDERGAVKYALPTLKRESMSKGGDSFIFTIISDSVRSVDYAMNTVVVKCTSGMAQAICAKLDSSELHNVVGTIAGDDTIFILMRSEKDAERLVKELQMLIRKDLRR